MRKFEFRPWGWFITLDEGTNYKVKKIYLKPNSKLSLQYHHHRDEHWTVVEGSGKCIVNTLIKSDVPSPRSKFKLSHYKRL